MEFGSAQRDMAAAYVGGAPGVVVSGMVWLVAAWVERVHGASAAFTALFFGGMLIFPASVAISRMLFRAPKAAPGNPLERLAIEGTAMLFAGILVGYVLLRIAPDLAFAAVALAIGARYLTFRSLYGEPLYWMLGATLAAAAALAMVRPFGIVSLVGGIECAFGALLFVRRSTVVPARSR